MGAGVSGWALARVVSSQGQLGVVSGTALDTILVRRLGAGDAGGHMRRAMAAFPAPNVVSRVLKRYFRPNGVQEDSLPCNSSRGPSGGPNTCAPVRADGDLDVDSAAQPGEGVADTQQRYKLVPLPSARLSREREWLLVLANFVEVFLAREGHDGVVGINYLHKVQFPTLPSLYGAMLAGVSVVLMGAGIPGDIPQALDRLSRNLDARIVLDVLDADDQKYEMSFDPLALWAEQLQCEAPPLHRPRFLAIISSATLARALLKKAPGGIDGFVVEAPISGGHNAPPRGAAQLSCRGEPIYGPRDDVDMAQMKALGAPFWLAGGFASREKLDAALAAGAHGIQVGTVFAFCDESGLDPDLRRRFLAGLLRGEGDVFTDPAASPTSFPFKVVRMPGTLSERDAYAQRTRVCDLGYLRRAYRKADGTISYRCPAEPVEDYVRKGGKAEGTIGRKCLCNALLANIGLGQQRSDGYEELPLLTAGNDLDCLRPFISPDRLSYSARDVIESLFPKAQTRLRG
jgi:NAD(P)H-dependent flavin oxidoreductase YrpB (nitropropane dioxygenase family)